MFGEARILITGGCGYIGFNLAQHLLGSGYKTIILYDLTPPKYELEEIDINQNSRNLDMISKKKIIYVEGDIRDQKHLSESIKLYSVDAVFHIAGYGLSGHSNLPVFDDVTYSVNVLGTKNVVRTCMANNVRALVFTSSVNVCFNGQPIINGSEEDHKWIVCKCSGNSNKRQCQNHHLDAYSKSKQDAEQIILSSSSQSSKQEERSSKNGFQNKSGSFNGLRTCVLRLPGVYGPGEEIIVKRTYAYINSFISSFFVLHKKDLKIDWIHVRNVIQAQTKAMERLLLPNCNISGELFHITDGNPTSTNFVSDPLKRYETKNSWFKSILSTISFLPVRVHEPIAISYSSLFLALSLFFGKKFRMPIWGFTPMELKKITVTHYFSIKKAEKLLGYKPEIRPDDWDEILIKMNAETRSQETKKWVYTKISFILLSGFILFSTTFLNFSLSLYV